jgi:multiple sugar transport system permease protein
MTKYFANRSKRKNAAEIALFVAAILAALLFILPTILTISNSFMSKTEINANYGAMISNAQQSGSMWGSGVQEESKQRIFISKDLNLKLIPDMVSFKQYITVLFMSPEYLLKFWNSVILTVPITVFQILLAAVTSYGFSRYKGKARAVIFFVYVILMLMPYQVTLVPNFMVSKWLNILETRWAIILPGIFSPFSIYLLTKTMRRIPTALYEAAKLDGCNEVQIFLHVVMPLTKNAMLSVGLLVFIDNWNMVEQPLILLKKQEMYPLSVLLSQINSGDVELAFAVAVIYMVPALLLFLYGEEYLLEGVSYSGGVKGYSHTYTERLGGICHG